MLNMLIELKEGPTKFVRSLISMEIKISVECAGDTKGIIIGNTFKLTAT